MIRKRWRWLAWSPILKRTVPFCVWYRWDPRPPSPVEQHNLEHGGHFDDSHHKMASVIAKALREVPCELMTVCYYRKWFVLHKSLPLMKIVLNQYFNLHFHFEAMIGDLQNQYAVTAWTKSLDVVVFSFQNIF